MKLPIRVDDNPGYDWGWVFLDADGRQVSPEEVANALNAGESQWKARFLWLWAAATDGFSSPEGWWQQESFSPSEQDLRDIDRFIADQMDAMTGDCDTTDR